MDTSMFGSKLLKGSTEISTDTLKQLKYIGIYFSGHWCPPCRGFTPALAEFYNKRADKGTEMDIIFVSSDRDENEFQEYYSEMPWLAVPFNESSVREKLKEKYGVRGIPFFVIINSSTGQLVTSDGRENVTSDPDNFPWDKQ